MEPDVGDGGAAAPVDAVVAAGALAVGGRFEMDIMRACLANSPTQL